MSDDDLKMQATVGDGYTAPLRALNNLLTQIATNPAGRQVTKDWQGVTGQINKLSTEIRTGLQPIMSGLGIASLGVSGAIGSAALALKNFAFNTRDITLFSKSIGLSVDQLRQLKAIGERFGVDWSQAQGSLKQFAGNMDQLQRRWGEAYGRLRAMGLGNLAEELVSAPNMQTALDRLFDGIKSIQNPVRRREIALLFFGSDQWATIASEMTPALRAEIKKLTAAITPEMQAASEKFVKNWQDMQQSVDNFVVQGLGPALPQINKLIDTLSKPVGEGLTKFFEGFNKAMKEFQAGNIGKGLLALDQSMAGPIEFGPKGTMPELQSQLSMKERDYKDAVGRRDTTGAHALSLEIRALKDAIDRLRKDGATVQPQSFDGGGGGIAGMVQRAAFNGGGGGGGGGNPFSPGFWGNVYRGGVGGDPFRGAGRSWDGQGGGGMTGQGGGSGGGQAGVGGSRSWRNNNPGNIEYGPFAKSMGATGSDGRFAIFPDYGAGRRAQEELLFNSKSYRNLTLAQAINRWAPGSENNVPAYLRAMGGDNPNKRMHQYSADERTKLLDAMQKHEGWREGRRGGGSGSGGAQGPEFLNDVIKAARDIGLHITSGYRSPDHPLSRRNPHSAHSRGLAFDTRAKNTDEGDAAMAKIRDLMKGRGLVEGRDFKFLDEVRHRVPWATGPHIHTEFTPDGAKRWGKAAEYAARRAPQASRTGDSMMGRHFGAGGVSGGAPKLDASGSVNITLSGGLEKMPARVSMDGLFKNVEVNRKPKATVSHVEDI